MNRRKKQEIITFKADQTLLRAMQGLPNRSEFIRNAILAALNSACPLCRGTGILSPDQREHWQEFAANHAVEECTKCKAIHLVCTADAKGGKQQSAGQLSSAH